MSRVDVVIFGATGFTGKYVVEEMLRLSKKFGLTWAVAGRSGKKLAELVNDIAKKTGVNLSKIKIIIADAADEISLAAMCQKARVVANCTSPYWLCGEAVVRAAIDSKTHYIDISAEPQFIGTMQLHYDKQARDAGVYVVSACGFDSIPNDMGVEFLKQQFGGILNSVESYLTIDVPPELDHEAKEHGLMNHGTWTSLVYSITNYHQIGIVTEKLYPEKLPMFKPTLRKRWPIHKRGGYWCTLFPAADEFVLHRSQRRMYDTLNERPAHFKSYFKFKSLIEAIVIMTGFYFFVMLTRWNFTRQLLMDNPNFFSLHIATREGPTKRVINACKFRVELFGEGWKDGTDVIRSPPNKKVAVTVSGTNGYRATAVALILSAVTILKEQNNMPDTGGVLTTAGAFRNTDLINLLHAEDIKFEVVN